MDKNEDGIVFFELWNSKGESIARKGNIDQLPIKFHSAWNDNFQESGFRNAYRKTEAGAVRIIVDAQSSFFQGKTATVRACNVYLSVIPKFEEVEKEQRQSFDAIVRRFAHNLIKFQTRFKSNFERLVSDRSRARPFDEFKGEVQRRIEENVSSAANDICEMSHRAIDLDSQIETLRIIAGYADGTGSLLSTNLQKAMYRLTNPFLEELRKRRINVLFNIDANPSGTERVKVVHGLFNAAIWQLLDNASKYVLNGTEINITADLQARPQKMFIAMTSVCIEEDELEEIFLEGRRGRHTRSSAEAQASIEGTGIGLFIVRKALGFMKATIHVTNDGFVRSENGHSYCRHTFVIQFTSE